MFSIVKSGFRRRAVLLALVLALTPLPALAVNFTKNVGIGTTTFNNLYGSNPKLNVVGNVQFSPSSASANQGLLISTNNLANGSNVLLFDAPSGWTGKFMSGNLNGTEQFDVSQAGGAFFNGSVGIGTTNPSAKLQVNGTISTGGYPGGIASTHGVLSGTNTAGYYAYYAHANGAGNAAGFYDSAGNGCVFAYGNTAWSCASDERLKTNITPISGSDALSKLALIKGVTFNWKYASSTAPRQIGVIAQDVLQAFPDAVSMSSDSIATSTQYYSVQYDSLIGPIISGINELNTRTGSLSADITALRTAPPLCRYEPDRQLTVGSPEKPMGVTMYDIQDGRPNCVYLSGGNLLAVLGTCEQTDARFLGR